MGELALSRWRHDPRDTITVELDVPWLEGHVPGSSVEFWKERPKGLITTIRCRSDGLIWVVGLVASSAWTPADRNVDRTNTDMVVLEHQYLDSVIALVDPHSQRVIISGRSREPIRGFASDSLLYSMSQRNDGSLSLRLHRIVESESR